MIKTGDMCVVVNGFVVVIHGQHRRIYRDDMLLVLSVIPRLQAWDQNETLIEFLWKSTRVRRFIPTDMIGDTTEAWIMPI